MGKHVYLSLNEKFDTFFNLPNHHSLSIQIDRIHEFVSSEEAKESPKIGELCTLGSFTKCRTTNYIIKNIQLFRFKYQKQIGRIEQEKLKRSK